MKRRGRSEEETSFRSGRTSREGGVVNIGWFGVCEGDGAAEDCDSPFGVGAAAAVGGRLLRTTVLTPEVLS